MSVIVMVSVPVTLLIRSTEEISRTQLPCRQSERSWLHVTSPAKTQVYPYYISD